MLILRIKYFGCLETEVEKILQNKSRSTSNALPNLKKIVFPGIQPNQGIFCSLWSAFFVCCIETCLLLSVLIFPYDWNQSVQKKSSEVFISLFKNQTSRTLFFIKIVCFTFIVSSAIYLCFCALFPFTFSLSFRDQAPL